MAISARVALAMRSGLLVGDPALLVTAALGGAQFLRNHALKADQSARYVLQRDGRPVEDHRDRLRNIYANCFVAMGQDIGRSFVGPQLT